MGDKASFVFMAAPTQKAGPIKFGEELEITNAIMKRSTKNKEQACCFIVYFCHGENAPFFNLNCAMVHYLDKKRNWYGKNKGYAYYLYNVFDFFPF